MPTRELYVQGTKELQPPGIEPPHSTTEDYRSRYWAVHFAHQFPSSATWWGVFLGQRRTCGRGVSSGRVCMGLNTGDILSGVTHRGPLMLHVDAVFDAVSVEGESVSGE